MPKALVLVTAASSGVRQHIANLLMKREDVVAIYAEDGSAALMLANIVKPQLLLLEAALPITSGFAVSYIVKQAPTLAQTPVVVFDVPCDPVNKIDRAVFRCDVCLNTGWAPWQMDLAIDRLLPKHH